MNNKTNLEQVNTLNATSVNELAEIRKPEHINEKHWHEMVVERGLDPEWIVANCKSMKCSEASQYLYCQAKSDGIWIEGARSPQGQFKPDKPWQDKKGQKAPKYRTPTKDDYDAFLPTPPNEEDIWIWIQIEELKSRCLWIDGNPTLVVTEGGFKAIAGCSHNIPTIGLCGVEQGLTSAKKDPQGKRYLIKQLEFYASHGFSFLIAFDADCATNKNVVQAEKKLAFQLEKMGASVYSATGCWNEEAGKGMDDYIQNHGIEEFRQRIMEAELVAEKYKDEEENGEKDKKKSLRSGELASSLYEKYYFKLAWDTSIQQWRRYGATQDGIWEKEVSEFVRQVLYAEIEAIPEIKVEDITPSLVKAVEELLQWKLAVRIWNVEDRNLLPMQNGVFNLETGQLMEHSPTFRLTWCLPISYDPQATCEPIKNWLLEACGGDKRLMELMRVYLYGVVTGRTDWQKYLELIGPSGTGKSTYIRLAIALVGQCNVHTTTLKKLEGSRFETACIKDKRLVVITDSERYSGEVSTLKALTGQDPIHYEVKMKQSTGGFVPRAMVVVAANEMIQSGDYTSGLKRRRVTVPFKNKVAPNQQRNLIELEEGNEINGEFVEYIPGLLNWVLDVDPQKATAMIKDYANAVPSLGRMQAESLVETNPIADWLDNAIVYRPDHKTQIGVAKRDKNSDTATQYYGVSQWLYANYCEYCANTQSKPIGLRRFVNLLSDLCNNQLGLDGVKRDRDRNGRYFVGLKIRTDEDNDPPLVTGQPVTDTVTDTVTDETPMSAKCDGCDGLSGKDVVEEKITSAPSTSSPPTKNSLSKEKEGMDTRKEKNSDDSSHGYNLASTSNSAVMPSVTDPSSTLHNDDFSTYPSRNSDDYRHKEKRANKCKEQMLECQTKEQLETFKADSDFSENELKWVWRNFLTNQEKAKVSAIAQTTQSGLFSQSSPPQSATPKIEDLAIGNQVWVHSRQSCGKVIGTNQTDPTHQVQVEFLNRWDWYSLEDIELLD